MTTVFPALQLLLLVSLGLGVGFFLFCLRNREKRGVTPLTLMFLGIIVWVSSELFQIQLRGTQFAGPGMALRFLGIEIGVIGVLLLGLEYTGREKLISRRLLVLLTIVPTLEVVVSLSPWRDLLFVIEPSAAAPWGYDIGITPLFIAHTLYSYGLIAICVSLLMSMMLRANAGYRRQLLAVLVAVLAPLHVNILFNLGVLPYDLTPVSFVLTATALAFATFELRLLDTIPVARRTVIEEMDDMVLMLDENNEIITANNAVTETFDVDGTLSGAKATRLFGDDGTEQLKSADGQHELTLEIDGAQRIIQIKNSEITDYRGNLLARVLVCRDVTEQKRREAELRHREEELEVLKDLQSRFLRHNLRNELNVVRANAQLLADMDDPDERDRYRTIIDKTDRILDWSTKARTIERLIETEEIVTRGAVTEIRKQLEELEAEYTAVTFELEADGESWISAVPQIDRALWNVLDNAARYNTAENPRVEVTVREGDDRVTVTVSDNGPGLATEEIETIEARSETKLLHGSGLGLWLVYWVLEKSGGSLSLDVDDGTSVTMQFQPGDPEAGSRSSVPLASDGGTE